MRTFLIWLVGLFIGIGLGMQFGMIVATSKIEKSAVKSKVGCYDNETGKFQWINVEQLK